MKTHLPAPDYPDVIWRPSPNFGERAGVGGVCMLILHYTGMESAEAAEQRLQDSQAQVSAHYVVREDGVIVQMVAEANRAWHAGLGCWGGCTDINSCSIGIEIVNAGPLADFPPFPPCQIEALTDLCQYILARHEINPRHVLGHSDVAPLRKIDPGEKFPWGVLAAAGIGHYVEPSSFVEGAPLALGDRGEEVKIYQEMLVYYGYGLVVNGEFDALTQSVTYAFQRHFYPQRVDGVADPAVRDTLQRLIGALQVL